MKKKYGFKRDLAMRCSTQKSMQKNPECGKSIEGERSLKLKGTHPATDLSEQEFPFFVCPTKHIELNHFVLTLYRR